MYPAELIPADYFKNSYGVMTSEDEEPEEIVLSFEPLQGKYIKSFPLHESQKILVDDDNELRVSLKLYITHDLIMELLSFGGDVTVLHPESLVKNVTTIITDMNLLYNKIQTN
jgi:predicted DNA-binding transcriptional regulator YafY